MHKLTPEQRLQIVEDYKNTKMTRAELAEKWGVSRETITRIMREHDIHMTPKSRRGSKFREQHQAWQGGTYVDKHGYILQKPPLGSIYEAMRQGKDGYVPQHRLVMAQSLGRILVSGETVHHINGDRQDNRIGNLQLRRSYHGPGQAWECLDCGSINIQAIQLAKEMEA